MKILLWSYTWNFPRGSFSKVTGPWVCTPEIITCTYFRCCYITFRGLSCHLNVLTHECFGPLRPSERLPESQGHVNTALKQPSPQATHTLDLQVVLSWFPSTHPGSTVSLPPTASYQVKNRVCRTHSGCHHNHGKAGAPGQGQRRLVWCEEEKGRKD